MAISQTMLFFDINYGEYASVTGTNVETATALYGYDNRSEKLVNFTEATGTFIYDYGTNCSFWIDTIILCNHNFSAFTLSAYVGSAWTSLGSYTGNSNGTTYISLPATLLATDVMLEISAVWSGTAYFGELITTLKKFQLVNNPSLYQPEIKTTGKAKYNWQGRLRFNPRADIFSAKIGWEALFGEINTSTNVDLQNITELFRNNTSFLFWPNAGNTTPYMFTWRQQDVFKCKVIDAVKYELFANHLDYVIRADGYVIQETA